MLQRISARDNYLMLFSVQNIVHTQMPQHILNTSARVTHTNRNANIRKRARTYEVKHLLTPCTCARLTRRMWRSGWKDCAPATRTRCRCGRRHGGAPASPTPCSACADGIGPANDQNMVPLKTLSWSVLLPSSSRPFLSPPLPTTSTSAYLPSYSLPPTTLSFPAKPTPSISANKWFCRMCVFSRQCSNVT